MRNEKTDKSFPRIRLADNPQGATSAELRRRKLKELSDRLDRNHAFAKGQFVAWKPGLRNRRTPDYREPAIIREVLPGPVFDPNENSAASAYFQEPLTIIIGTYLDDDLVEFRVDGRRFEPFDC